MVGNLLFHHLEIHSVLGRDYNSPHGLGMELLGSACATKNILKSVVLKQWTKYQYLLVRVQD